MTTQPRWRTRAASLIGLSLVVALVATSCRTADSTTAGNTATTVPKDGGSIVMAVDQETDGWQPQISQWANAGFWAGSAVIEPLATFDEHGETVMWLAESIDPTVAGKFDSWRIKVKPNIKFHNGEDLNAKVLLANLELITNGRSLSGIVLGPKFHDFTEVDNLTVQVNLNQPWSDFPSILAGSTGMVTAKAQLDSPFGGLDHPIGTGPYVFESWEPNVSFKATKNPNYWRKGEPHLDSIEFRPFVDNKKALSALQNGDVDMIVTTKAEDVALAGSGMVVETDYGTEKTSVQANTAQFPDRPFNPLTNVHARRALAYGTDREAIRKQVGAGQDIQTSTQPMVSGTPWAVPEDQTGYPAYDVAKAKAEVELYKADTNQPFVMELNSPLAPDDLAIANALADQWKAIGVTANVKGLDTNTNTANTVFGKFDGVIQRNFAYPNPSTDASFYESATAKGPGNLSINFSQYKSPEIDAAAADAYATDDRARQRDDWLAITKIANEQALNLWLFDTPYAVIHTPAVQGLETLKTHSFAASSPRPWLWGNVWRQS